MKCANCGTDLVTDAVFCVKCGGRVAQSEDQSPAASGRPSEGKNSTQVHEQVETGSVAKRYVRSLRLFVKINQGYYLSKWRVMDNSNGIFSILSWNWAACVFGVFWLVFRKMYLYALLYSVALGLNAFLFIADLISERLYGDLGLLFNMSIALVGNHVYRLHVDRELARIKSKYPDERTQDIVIAKNGGQVLGGSLQFPAPVVI